MRSLLACALLVAVSTAGCALDRHGLAARDPAPDGSVAMLDASLDAGGTSLDDAGGDAGRPCDTPCTDGRVCEGGACVCPFGACCPACTASQTCSSGTCVALPCGGAGQPCCDTAPQCTSGNGCVGGTCSACGHAGEPCCGTSCSDGSTCSSGMCQSACGGNGEACCSGNTCDMGFACDDPLIGTASCAPCGGEGELCCPGSLCSGSFYCETIAGRCRSCGGYLARCCAGDTCSAGTCRAGYCS